MVLILQYVYLYTLSSSMTKSTVLIRSAGRDGMICTDTMRDGIFAMPHTYTLDVDVWWLLDLLLAPLQPSLFDRT